MESFEFTSGEIVSSPEQIADLFINENGRCKIVRYDENRQKMYIRHGILKVDGTSCSWWWPADYSEKCQLYCQIEIYPDPRENLGCDDKCFASEGDSGSLVFLQSEHRDNPWAIGMVVAGIPNTGSVIVTPIWAILEKFGLPLRLESFDNPRLCKVVQEIKQLGNKINQTVQQSVQQSHQSIQQIIQQSLLQNIQQVQVSLQQSMQQNILQSQETIKQNLLQNIQQVQNKLQQSIQEGQQTMQHLSQSIQSIEEGLDQRIEKILDRSNDS